MFQENLKIKLTTLKRVNEKFQLGTEHLMEMLIRNNMKYKDYQSLSNKSKKPYKTQADDLLLLCWFIKNCKQWGNVNIRENLENFISFISVVAPIFKVRSQSLPAFIALFLLFFYFDVAVMVAVLSCFIESYLISFRCIGEALWVNILVSVQTGI